MVNLYFRLFSELFLSTEIEYFEKIKWPKILCSKIWPKVIFDPRWLPLQKAEISNGKTKISWNSEVKWKTMWAITCLLRASSFFLFHLSILYCTCFICCYFLGINDYALWIGVNDLIKEGKWTWISDHSTIGYSNWKRGEPNSGDEHCGEIYKKNSFTWNNAECYQLHGYICEKWWLMGNEMKYRNMT